MNIAEGKGRFSKKEFDPYFRQGALGLRLDTLVSLFDNVKFPNHIKIDVDGNECKILQGAGKVAC